MKPPEIDRRSNQTFRILPRKGSALLGTLFAVILLFFVNSGMGTVKVNGRVVTGAERASTLNDMRLIFDPFLLVMLGWCGRRLLPESPYDSLEISEDGLVVRGLVGTKRLPWQAILSLTSRSSHPWTYPAMVWITVRTDPAQNEGQSSYRVGMGGYVGVGLNPFRADLDDVAEIASWLGRVKDAYRAAPAAVLPAIPSALENSVIEVAPSRPRLSSEDDTEGLFQTGAKRQYSRKRWHQLCWERRWTGRRKSCRCG